MASLKETMEARKAEIDVRLDAIVKDAETREIPNVTDEEAAETQTLLEERKGLIPQIATQVQLEEIRVANAAALPPQAGTFETTTTTELRTEPYRKGGKESYFHDLYKAGKGDRAAVDRLTVSDRWNASQLEKRAGTTTVAGAGGEFAPPLWQIDQFVTFARAGRPFADILNKEALPAGVSSINLPTITTGATTGAQTTQNVAITDTDIVTSSVTGTVKTIAGGVVVSLQVLEQSPVSMDAVILQDLSADLAQQLDLAVIAAIAGVSGINAITYTNASPTTPLLLGNVQKGVDTVHQNIFKPATAMVMRPDRWGRIAAAQDTTGRPFLPLSAVYGRFNSVGAADGQTAQGPAGEISAIPVYLDANIPVNLGGGTNQDEVFILRPEEINLYEGPLNAQVFDQTYANTNSVFCRVYEFYALIANRRPKAISLITGTGMIPGTYGL